MLKLRRTSITVSRHTHRFLDNLDNGIGIQAANQFLKLLCFRTTRSEERELLTKVSSKLNGNESTSRKVSAEHKSLTD